MISNNSLNLMDCIAGMAQLTEKSTDLVVADPPYNVGGKSNHIISIEKKFSSIKEEWDTVSGCDFEEFNKRWINESYRILKDGGSLLCWGSRHNLYLCGHLIEKAGFTIRTEYVWYKTNAMPCITGRNPSESTEHLIWATKGKCWTYNLSYAKSINNGQNIRNIFTTIQTPQKERQHGKHPSQKRLEGLTDHLINLHSNPNDIIVVPFCGSGTECVAAAKSGRNYIAFELEEKYLEIAKKRLA